MIVRQQDDMIRQAAEAAQHHIFIARQPFARPQRGLPFALQNGNVIEHLGVAFAGRFRGRFLGRNHVIPHSAHIQP
jgi:hypothetical protein